MRWLRSRRVLYKSTSACGFRRLRWRCWLVTSLLAPTHLASLVSMLLSLHSTPSVRLRLIANVDKKIKRFRKGNGTEITLKDFKPHRVQFSQEILKCQVELLTSQRLSSRMIGLYSSIIQGKKLAKLPGVEFGSGGKRCD